MKKIFTKIKNLKIQPVVFLIIITLYLELLFKHILVKNIFNIGLIYTLIYSIPIFILFVILTKSFKEIVNKIFMYLTTVILVVYFEVQFIFYTLFQEPFSFTTIGLANQALDFRSIVVEAIGKHWLMFALFLLPLLLVIILRKKYNFNRYHKHTNITLVIMLMISFLSTYLTLIPKNINDNNSKELYFNTDDAKAIINRFGLLTYTRIDIKRQIFGYETKLVFDNYVLPQEEKSDVIEEVEYGINILDLNLEDTNNRNINTINTYVMNKQATTKNQYTGMFKNKNLIFILAEGFNEVAVDETRTPTLYKLVHNGFVFNNFYSPLFLSTTGGEFQATTGLIPTQETLSMWKSKQPKISYGIGNSFGGLGYRTYAYHNWTYTYYKRNITMNTLGFTNYIGCGNGMEKRLSCNWLPSDIEMIDQTVPDYLGGEGPFATYYVTVSGHSPYNNSSNIARKYMDLVNDTNYSTDVKYYLASQVELDKMLEELINKLTESGELDNTVIALVGDHYPYTLTIDQMNEVATYQKDGTIEVNHSNFILWSNTIEEPIVIDKVGSQVDVLPTLLNLFGIDYDSRLIVGQDLLSDCPGIAIFSDRSWVTDYGHYFATRRQFIPKEGKELEDVDGYIRYINNTVANSYSISKLMIENDYYNYILNK